MVSLPDVPSVGGLVLSQPPQSQVSPGQIAQPYQELARSLDDIGEAFKDASIPLAEQAGYQAVTKDADGNIQVERAPIIGAAAGAYSRAVKVGALAAGEGEARRRDVEMRQQFRDDPAGYEKAATAFKDSMIKQYTSAAGPEVGVALGRAIDGSITQTYKGLLNEKERLDLQRAVLGIDSEIEYTKNQQYALVEQGGSGTPEYRANDAKIEALYHELGANPRLAYPPEKIRNELENFRSELKVKAIGHEIIDNVYPKEGYEAAVKAADEVLKNPNFNLSDTERRTFRGRIISDLNSRARDDFSQQKAVGRQIEDVQNLAADGYMPPPEQMAQLHTTVEQSKNPALIAAMKNVDAAVPVMQQWRQMSPTQLEASLSELDRTMREKGATPGGVAMMATGQKLLTNMRKAVGADPLTWADRVGIQPIRAIDFSSADAVAQMKDRVTRAEVVASHYGIAPTYLTPDERQSLKAAAAAGGPALMSMAKGIADGFGDRSNRVLAEVSKDAPVLAHMGGLLNGGLFGGGSETFARDVAEAVQLNSNPDTKKLLPHWAQQPTDSVFQLQNARKVDQYGGAFAMVPNNGRAAEASARAAWTTRAVKNGYDPKQLDQSGEGRNAYDRALQEAAGATFSADGKQYGGVTDYKPGYWTNYKVLVPGNIRSDRFKDVIGAIKDDDLRLMPISPETADGKAYTARDLQGSVPVAVSGGYRFAQGDPTSNNPKWIRGADGKPFVLDMDRLEPVLRQRAPGAYLGSR